MERLSNRNHHSDKQEPIVRYVYVETPAPQSETKIEYVDREVQVPAETDSDHRMLREWCQQRIDEQNVAHAWKLQDIRHDLTRADISNTNYLKLIADELEMQRRALVAIKMQRDVDRKRRLQLIQRLKRERDNNRELTFKIKLAMGASLLISILTFIIK